MCFVKKLIKHKNLMKSIGMGKVAEQKFFLVYNKCVMKKTPDNQIDKQIGHPLQFRSSNRRRISRKF